MHHKLILRLFFVLLFASSALAKPEKWESRINEMVHSDSVTPPPKDPIVFVGSSSIVKWKTMAEDFAGKPVMNRGFGGSELADSVFYADRIVIPYHPRLVVLYAGENDVHNGRKPELILADFVYFCRKVHDALPKTRILYVSIKPSPSRWRLRDQIVRTNSLIATECAKDPRRGFIDVYVPMLDAKGEPKPELFTTDRLHMNAEGYAIWKKVLAPHLDR